MILAHFGPNGLLAQELRALGALQGPLVTIFHGRDISHAIRRHGPAYYATLFEQGERMLPVSRYFAARLRELGCSASKIHVQRMGVDTQRYVFRPRALSDGARVRFVTVCRLVPKKGLAFGADGLAGLLATEQSFEWHIVGDGPERARLQAQCERLQLSKHVTFHGALPRDRAREVLESSHVFLGPSITPEDGDQEGVPVALMEAAASGMPIVSTLHSGIPELVRDGESGYLVPEWDVAALTAALSKIMRARADWPAMGRAARDVVACDFELSTLDDQLVDQLEAVARA